MEKLMFTFDEAAEKSKTNMEQLITDGITQTFEVMNTDGARATRMLLNQATIMQALREVLYPPVHYYPPRTVRP